MIPLATMETVVTTSPLFSPGWLTARVCVAARVGLLLLFGAFGVSAALAQDTPCGCVVIIDEDTIDNGVSTIEAAAASHSVTPDVLVNDDHPTENGNPSLHWNVNFPGDVAWLPTGETQDEGLFFLPPTIVYKDGSTAASRGYGSDAGWIERFIKGTIPQADLDEVLNVDPLGNSQINGLVGKRCVAVVYDSDISINTGPLMGNLQGARYGLFYFSVLATRAPQLPESTSSTSLREIQVRVDSPSGVSCQQATTDPELRIEITNLIDEPPGGWEPGNTIKLGINLCNNEFNDAFSDGLCQGSTTWDNPVTDRDIKTKVLLPSRLSYADNATCTLDTDGDGQFDDGACPGGSFNIVATAEPLIVIGYPDLPVGQGAQVIFETTLTDGGTEDIQVSAEISQGSPSDEDATPDNCNLAGGAPGIGEDDCDKLVFAVQPVELTRFDAELDGRTARLVWETASETNNSGFEVQHRPAEAGSFAPLGFVEGHGTTLEGQSYRFSVADLTPGRHVFRLKQIDFDGTFEYSPEVEVSVEMPEAFLVSKVYPNPFNPQASFSFGVKQEQAVTVEVYNMLGQRVLTLYQGRPASGVTQMLQIDARALQSGIYLLRVQGERFADTQTITVIK